MDFDQAENPPILSAASEAPPVRLLSVWDAPHFRTPPVAAASDVPRGNIVSTVAQPHAPRRPASSIAAVISVIGEGYSRPVIEGTTSEVLDTFGLGHYPGMAMPGDEGNFAVAGHRQTNGAVLDHIDALTEGERIHVRTADGYYTYLYSETLIVLPTQTDVIAPVPGEPGEPADGGCMTLTSCNPRFGDTERIIVHAQLESWRPNSAGPPPDIADVVQRDADGQ